MPSKTAAFATCQGIAHHADQGNALHPAVPGSIVSACCPRRALRGAAWHSPPEGWPGALGKQGRRMTAQSSAWPGRQKLRPRLARSPRSRTGTSLVLLPLSLLVQVSYENLISVETAQVLVTSKLCSVWGSPQLRGSRK